MACQRRQKKPQDPQCGTRIRRYLSPSACGFGGFVAFQSPDEQKDSSPSRVGSGSIRMRREARLRQIKLKREHAIWTGRRFYSTGRVVAYLAATKLSVYAPASNYSKCAWLELHRWLFTKPRLTPKELERKRGSRGFCALHFAFWPDLLGAEKAIECRIRRMSSLTGLHTIHLI